MDKFIIRLKIIGDVSCTYFNIMQITKRFCEIFFIISLIRLKMDKQTQ